MERLDVLVQIDVVHPLREVHSAHAAEELAGFGEVVRALEPDVELPAERLARDRRRDGRHEDCAQSARGLLHAGVHLLLGPVGLLAPLFRHRRLGRRVMRRRQSAATDRMRVLFDVRRLYVVGWTRDVRADVATVRGAPQALAQLLVLALERLDLLPLLVELPLVRAHRVRDEFFQLEHLLAQVLRLSLRKRTAVVSLPFVLPHSGQTEHTRCRSRQRREAARTCSLRRSALRCSAFMASDDAWSFSAADGELVLLASLSKDSSSERELTSVRGELPAALGLLEASTMRRLVSMSSWQSGEALAKSSSATHHEDDQSPERLRDVSTDGGGRRAMRGASETDCQCKHRTSQWPFAHRRINSHRYRCAPYVYQERRLPSNDYDRESKDIGFNSDQIPGVSQGSNHSPLSLSL